MRFFFVIVIVLIGVFRGLQSPIVASMFYSWVALFRPQDFLHSGFNIPSLVPISFAILVVSIVISLIKRKIHINWNIGTHFLLTIFAVCIVSALLSSSQTIVWEKNLEIVKILLPAVIISMSISSEKHFKMLIYAFAFSIGLWAIQGGLHGLMLGRAQAAMSIGGQMSDRNDFAVAILMTLPLWYYSGLNSKSMFRRNFCYFFSALIAFSIIVTNSRAAILGLMVLCFVVFVWQTKHRLRSALLLILLGGIGINFVPTYTFERLSTIEWSSEQTDGSASERLVLMRAGLDGALDNPWLGVGPGAWSVRAHDYIPPENAGSKAYEPHSIWLKIAAELGFVGLGVYVCMFYVLFNALKIIYKKSILGNDLVWANYSLMLQMGLFSYCFAGTFFNQIYYEYLFLMVAVVGGFLNVSKEHFKNASV